VNCTNSAHGAGQKALADNPEIRDFPYVLTTSWHLERVEPRAAALGKKLLEIKPDRHLRRDRQADADAQRAVVVGICGRCTLPLTCIEHFLSNTSKRFMIATLADGELIEQIAGVRCGFLLASVPGIAAPAIASGQGNPRFKDFISDEFIESLNRLGLFE